MLTVDAYQKNAKKADRQVSVQIVVGKSVAAGIILIVEVKTLIFGRPRVHNQQHNYHHQHYHSPPKTLVILHIRRSLSSQEQDPR